MDPSAIVGFLAPFLPYLLTAGQNLAEEAVRKLGREGWDHAQALWQRLRPGVEAKPAAQEAAADVAAAPDDPLAQSALAQQVRKLLESDPALAEELSRIWEQGRAVRQTIASGERSVAVGGDVKGSVIQTGDQNRVGR